MKESLEELLVEIEGLLDQLIGTAELLSEVSAQAFAEEELLPLQEKQEAIIQSLREMDARLHAHFPEERERITSRLKEKLTSFQRLNRLFIRHLGESHGLIHFGGD